MEQPIHTLLADWENFYIIAGSVAGALIGLQFVVIALVADSRRRTTSPEIAAFGTPTILHFCAALLLSAPAAALLGEPEYDPHGDPIPNQDLQLPTMETVSLSEVRPGKRVVVRRVPTSNPALLRYLGEMGVLPGAEIYIVAHIPFDRTVRIRVEKEGCEHVLGAEQLVIVVHVMDAVVFGQRALQDRVKLFIGGIGKAEHVCAHPVQLYPEIAEIGRKMRRKTDIIHRLLVRVRNVGIFSLFYKVSTRIARLLKNCRDRRGRGSASPGTSRQNGQTVLALAYAESMSSPVPMVLSAPAEY